LRRVCERGGWGRLSDDGPGQHNLDRSEGPWGRAVNPLARRCRCHVPYLDSERGHMALKTTRRSEANHGGLLIDPSYLGQAPTDSRPWSRTGENPPYGILGGTMETSASFEARLAPSSYPTCSEDSCRSSRWKSCRWKCPSTTVVIPDGEEGDRLDRKLGSKSLGWPGAVHSVRSARGKQISRL
jgi:hypothetical protein